MMKSQKIKPSHNGVLDKFRALSSWISDLSLGLSAVALLVSLALIGWGMVMRYVFNQAPIWLDDLVGFLLIAIVMLASAATYRKDEHIGVDLLVSRFSSQTRHIMSIWSATLTCLVALMLLINGWKNAQLARMLGLLTEGHLEWPQWILMLLLPIGGALLLLVSMETLINLLVSKSKKEDT